MFMPFQILAIWSRGILAAAIIGIGICLFAQWYKNREHVIVERVPNPTSSPVVADSEQPDTEAAQGNQIQSRVVKWHFGLNRETAFLLGSLASLGWAIGGGWLANPVLWRRSTKENLRQQDRGRIERLRRPDGSELNVVSYGSPNLQPIICTHGWGLDSNEWVYAKRELGERYQLITWDLPGLGESSRPADNDWSLEKLAQHLHAVTELAGDRPVILLGHSIGVMIILTYCKLFPDAIGTRVRGLILAHGTYTNPVKTASKATLYTALQKPLLEPLCHLMIWLAPFLRMLNWLSYLNGSAHRSTERDSFSGKETRGQLDFITRYYGSAPPAVLGRGMLAMFRYDATDTLTRISAPTLIITGDNDKTCTPEASKYMANRISGSELVKLPAVKHCGLFELHGQFHEAIVEFLEDNVTPVVVPTALPRNFMTEHA